MKGVITSQQLYWNSDLPSCSISDFLYGKNIYTFGFDSGPSELAWFILQNAYLQRCQLTLVMSHFTKVLLHGNKIFSSSRRLRREKRREKTRARFIKFLGQASVSLAFFFFSSNQVLACNSQNNSFEPTIEEKNSFLIKKVAFCMIGLLALGAVGYVLSSTTVPYFIKLAPSVKKNIVSPVLDILPTVLVNTLPTGIDVIGISNKGSEFLRVPHFLSSPFSSDLSTLSERIFEAIEFLGKVEAYHRFSLQKYSNESYNIMSLMVSHIDSLTALVGESKGNHSTKIILLNEAYNRVCTKNLKTCIRVLLLKAK